MLQEQKYLRLEWMLITRIQSSAGRENIFAFIEVNYDKQCEPFLRPRPDPPTSVALLTFPPYAFPLHAMITEFKSSYVLMIKKCLKLEALFFLFSTILGSVARTFLAIL